MKRTRPVPYWAIPEKNQRITDSRYCPLMQHPNQIDVIEADNQPVLTVWDTINLSNGHDLNTLNKRAVFDSVGAEQTQIFSRGRWVALQWETGAYPCVKERDGDGTLAAGFLTVTFTRQPTVGRT